MAPWERRWERFLLRRCLWRGVRALSKRGRLELLMEREAHKLHVKESVAAHRKHLRGRLWRGALLEDARQRLSRRPSV